MRRPAFILLACLVIGLSAMDARACSVCFGDPDSPMTHGVIMGIWVLIGVVGFVLTLVAGTGLYWLHRSRRLALAHHTTTHAASNENPHG